MLREESIGLETPCEDAPGPKTFWPLGFTKPFAKDPVATLEGLQRDYGDVARVRIFIWQLHLISHPEYVKHVLQENHQNYHKSVVYQFLKPVVGEGLLTSEDDFWKRQRRIAAPAFHRKVLAGLATAMTQETESMLVRWHAFAKRDQSIDALSEFMALTLEIVSRTMLSTDVAGETTAVRESVSVLRDHVNYRMMHIVSLPERVPTPRNRRFARALHAVDRIVYGMIEERRAGGVVADDLLSMLMSVRDEETGESMSDKQVRDEVMTIFLAGHETTAAALSWTFSFVSQQPDVEGRLLSEIDNALGGRTPGIEDLPKLPYTRMVIDEALRLYPPAWAFGRQAIADDEIGGYRIPANSGVLVSPWITHRHHAFWDRPERFDPERFAPEKAASRPRYAYLPFGGGPRQCIGNEFALMEMQLVLATIVQRFSLRLPPGHHVEPDFSVTLRPLGPLPMALTARR